MKTFSPSKYGFFTVGKHAVIPEDAIEVTEEEFQVLYAGISEGKVVVVEDGKAILKDQVVSDDALIEQCRLEAQRRLNNTDWTQFNDVNPKLSNASEFATYRDTVRELRTTPVKDPKWPAEPTPVWK